jgi:peptide/nickel transport system permease protein
MRDATTRVEGREPGISSESRYKSRPVFATFADNRMGLVGAVICLVLILFSFVGPLIYHTNQINANFLNSNDSPSLQHLLGTDNTGYDILGRLMVGGRVALEIGFGVAVVATALGSLWGALAGYAGGVLDAVMMRLVDVMLALPALFLVLFIATIIVPSVPVLIVVISAISWLTTARLVRAEAISLRSLAYVEAARCAGASHLRILLRHIIPNAGGTIAVTAALQVANAVLLVAYLSFLGLGLPPPATDWGSMLSNGTSYMAAGYWWEVWPAGLAIVATVIAFNLVGEALHATIEVRLQGR